VLNLPGREINHSSPTSAESKNECILPLIPICLRVLQTENFILLHAHEVQIFKNIRTYLLENSDSVQFYYYLLKYVAH